MESGPLCRSKKHRDTVADPGLEGGGGGAKVYGSGRGIPTHDSYM